MLRSSLTLIVAAVFLAAAAPKPTAPAAKPPVKAAVAKPAPARPAPAKTVEPDDAAPYDARDPGALVDLLPTLDAKGEIVRREDDSVFVKVTTPAYAFGAQFAGCDESRRVCRAVAFSTQSDTRTVTTAQINGFNQTSITCKGWLDKANKPHVSYAALLSPHDRRAETRAHLGAWQGCLADFGDFLKDPNAFLAEAP